MKTYAITFQYSDDTLKECFENGFLMDDY